MRLHLLLLFIIALIPLSANAQPVSPYAAPDRELWDLMSKAFDDIPMSMSAHQQIQAIVANVQREAQMREARAKAKPIEAPKEDGK